MCDSSKPHSPLLGLIWGHNSTLAIVCLSICVVIGRSSGRFLCILLLVALTERRVVYGHIVEVCVAIGLCWGANPAVPVLVFDHGKSVPKNLMPIVSLTGGVANPANPRKLSSAFVSLLDVISPLSCLLVRDKGWYVCG